LRCSAFSNVEDFPAVAWRRNQSILEGLEVNLALKDSGDIVASVYNPSTSDDAPHERRFDTDLRAWRIGTFESTAQEVSRSVLERS
jgi:hypothetical protein